MAGQRTQAPPLVLPREEVVQRLLLLTQQTFTTSPPPSLAVLHKSRLQRREDMQILCLLLICRWVTSHDICRGGTFA